MILASLMTFNAYFSNENSIIQMFVLIPFMLDGILSAIHIYQTLEKRIINEDLSEQLLNNDRAVNDDSIFSGMNANATFLDKEFV